MSTQLDELLSPSVDFKRDRWGRPNIMQPNGKRKGYTRCSSAAKTIEDTFNLEKWARRNVAYGLAHDASLVARVLAIGGEPAAWDKAAKDAVNDIVEAAAAVAKAHRAADIGTAVHKLTERLDRGEDVVGGPYQADLDAYRAAMKAAGFVVHPMLVECRMVNDDLEMAGTADRIVYDHANDRHHIADIKTSASVDFGGLGWSAQLAAYAGGLLYDIDTEQRVDTPTLDRDVGYIIHLPAGRGVCTIYEVDLVGGLAAARLANEVRAVRKQSKQWIVAKTSVALDRDALRDRYRALPDVDQERFQQLNIPKDDLAAIAAALDELENQPTMLERARERMAAEPAKPVAVADDEGGEADVDEELRVLAEWMTPEQRAWVGSITSSPISTGTPIRYTYRKVRRRADVCLTLAKWAVSSYWDAGSDEALRAAIYVVLGDDQIFGAAMSLADALAQFNTKDASEFKDLVDGITADQFALIADEATGQLRWKAAA